MKKVTWKMDSLDAALFLRLAKTKSFKVAGELVGISRSAVSKRISKLEAELGVTLVNRSTRSIGLTEAGQTFVQHCSEIQRTIEAAEASVHEHDDTPQGVLRFSLPSALGAALLPGLIKEFSAKYPRLRLSVHFAEPFVDVIAGGYDVVIRVARKLPDSTLIARKLGETMNVLVAAPSVLEEYGVPKHPRELKGLPCVGLNFAAETPVTWHFRGPDGPIDVPLSYAFSANNELTLNLAACLGAGFLYTPRLSVGSEISRERLCPVLPEFSGPGSYGVFAIYPQQSPPIRVQAFIEFVRERLTQLEYIDRWNPLGG